MYQFSHKPHVDVKNVRLKVILSQRLVHYVMFEGFYLF